MELGTKLRICTAFSVLALIFKIIVFVSPGWAVVKSDIYVEPTDAMLPQDDGIDPEMQPDDLSLSPTRKHVSISFGVWYYKVCMCDKGDDDKNDGSSEEEHHHRKQHGHHKCFHRCYRKEKPRDDNGHVMEDRDDNIPPEFRPAREFITTSVEFARHGRHELAAYVTIGLVLGVIGLIGAIKYARGGGVGKHSGRLACSTQVISSFFFWMAIIRVGTYIIQLNMARHYDIMHDLIGRDTQFVVPWCLIVGAIGAVIMDFAALFHMILISRDRKSDGGQYTFHAEKGKTPIMAPVGYNQLVFPYLQMNEEAGPLPEKPPIS